MGRISTGGCWVGKGRQDRGAGGTQKNVVLSQVKGLIAWQGTAGGRRDVVRWRKILFPSKSKSLCLANSFSWAGKCHGSAFYEHSSENRFYSIFNIYFFVLCVSMQVCMCCGIHMGPIGGLSFSFALSLSQRLNWSHQVFPPSHLAALYISSIRCFSVFCAQPFYF